MSEFGAGLSAHIFSWAWPVFTVITKNHTTELFGGSSGAEVNLGAQHDTTPSTMPIDVADERAAQRKAMMKALDDDAKRQWPKHIDSDLVQQQRSRASWSAARSDGVNPTYDGLLAGAKSGAILTIVGLAAVGAATVMSPAFRTASSPGARAWLVCTAGMAGFFFNSEMAVVGTDARSRER